MEIMKLTCRRCGGKFPMSKIRMDPKTNNYVCHDCLRVSNSLSEPTRMTSVKDMERLREKRRKEKLNNTEFITYKCPSCKFKTRFKAEKVPKKCTYCGAAVDLDMNQETDMNQIIREVDDGGFSSR